MSEVRMSVRFAPFDSRIDASTRRDAAFAHGRNAVDTELFS